MFVTTKPTDIQIHRFRDAGICVLVLVLAELKSEEERAESVWDKGKGLCGRNDKRTTVAVVRAMFVYTFALCFYLRTSLV